MISFRDLCKSHNFGAKETHKDFRETEYLQNVFHKKNATRTSTGFTQQEDRWKPSVTQKNSIGSPEDRHFGEK